MTTRARWSAAVAVVAVVCAVHAAQAAPIRAPDFRLPLLGGGTVSLATFKGRPAILLFWAPW